MWSDDFCDFINEIKMEIRTEMRFMRIKDENENDLRGKWEGWTLIMRDWCEDNDMREFATSGWWQF